MTTSPDDNVEFDLNDLQLEESAAASEAIRALDEADRAPKRKRPPVVDIGKLRACCERWLHDAAQTGVEPPSFTVMQKRWNDLSGIVKEFGVEKSDADQRLKILAEQQPGTNGDPKSYPQMKADARKLRPETVDEETVKQVTRTIVDQCASYEAYYLALLAKTGGVAVTYDAAQAAADELGLAADR